MQGGFTFRQFVAQEILMHQMALYKYFIIIIIIKATEQNFAVVLFIMLLMGRLTFETYVDLSSCEW